MVFPQNMYRNRPNIPIRSLVVWVAWDCPGNHSSHCNQDDHKSHSKYGNQCKQCNWSILMTPLIISTRRKHAGFHVKCLVFFYDFNQNWMCRPILGMKMAVFWVAAPCNRRYNPEDSHLRTHRRENLKSYIILGILPGFEFYRNPFSRFRVVQCGQIYRQTYFDVAGTVISELTLADLKTYQ
jgi:hypothetical protein